MAISPPQGSPAAAIAVGWKAQLQAQELVQVMDISGLSNPELDRAFDSLEQSGKSISQAGAELAQIQAVGQLIDVIG